MKVKMIQLSVLLFLVMSVVFLSQTSQDVIGHDEIDPNTAKAHEPPGHSHNPSVLVDSVTGNLVMSGGVDPRGNHYSGTFGNTEDGYQSAWGFRYGGGTYAMSPSGPDSDTQNVWYLRVNAETSAGKKHARVKVSPSIYFTQFHKDEESWQGAGTGTVTFSKVNFHMYTRCLSTSREGETWTDTGFIDLRVKKAKISKGKKKKYGVDFEKEFASLTAESEDTYTTFFDDLQARGYCFILELNAGFFDNYIPKFQDKSAEGSGRLNSEIISDTAKAEYKWTKWGSCSCGESKSPNW